MSTITLERKLKNRDQLREIAAAAKARGKTVVTTNGCFDILHIGHIRYLQDARARGDILILGVNSDDSVRRLKGPDLQVVSQAQRAEILAALECVDYVTIFDEDTPIELILAIRPDVHVKGGDRDPNAMIEAPAVRSVGGRVEVVSYTSTETEGWSTSNLIGKIAGTERRVQS